MANPSTIGGTGAGTEVVRRAWHVVGSLTTRTILTGVANHLYTILSIVVTNHAGTANTFDLYILPDGQTEKAYLAKQIVLPGTGTFVWNDKVVMDGTGDDLIVLSNAACELKCWVSFIDQTFA